MEILPKASIIIPCFNRIDRTTECWEALQRTVPHAITHEIIFVDNASTDETGEFLATLEKASSAEVISNGVNLGFARANNQGALRARGEFLIFLNNDTVPLQRWIEPLLELAENDPTIGAVGSKLIYPDGRVQHAGVVVKDRGPNQLLCDHVYRLSRHDAPWVNVEREYQAVTGACLTVRREIFERLNGFDEAFINGSEDVDFCFRLRAAGLRVVYCPRSVVMHYESSSQGRFASDLHNRALLTERWAAQIKSDETEIYAATARPNLDQIHAELQSLRSSFDKIQSSPRVAKKNWKAFLRRSILRWLGLERTLKQISDDLRALQKATNKLRRVTEAMALFLDYQQIDPSISSPDGSKIAAPSSRADSFLH